MFQLPVQNGSWVIVVVAIVVASVSLPTAAAVDGSISVVFILSNGILQ
jgi:hypothetical protein